MSSEILFITIVGRRSKYVPQKKQVWDIIHFRHIGRDWQSSEHMVSPEKYEFQNCYDHLHIGSSYILVAKKHDDLYDVIGGERKHRWVWAGAVEMTEPQLRKVAAFHRKNPDPRAVLSFADSIKYPKPTDLCDEFDWV